MTGLIGPRFKGTLPTELMLRFMRNSCMPERRDWNAMGPVLPAWFRGYLRRIDPSLVLQFVPPSTHAKGGCSPERNPFGVWAICRRMPNTGWLCKRWVYDLSTPDGRHLPPTRDLVELLIKARDLWRKGQMDHLENLFDRNMAARQKEAEAESKQRMAERIEQRMRRMGLRDRIKPRISLARCMPAWLGGKKAG